MAVYVDWLLPWGWRLRGHTVSSCHLMADTEEELHAFAQALGMRREWFQLGSVPHYDLTAVRRRKAVTLGAVELTRATFSGVFKRLRVKSKATAMAATNATEGKL